MIRYSTAPLGRLRSELSPIPPAAQQQRKRASLQRLALLGHRGEGPGLRPAGRRHRQRRRRRSRRTKEVGTKSVARRCRRRPEPARTAPARGSRRFGRSSPLLGPGSRGAAVARLRCFGGWKRGRGGSPPCREGEEVRVGELERLLLWVAGWFGLASALVSDVKPSPPAPCALPRALPFSVFSEARRRARGRRRTLFFMFLLVFFSRSVAAGSWGLDVIFMANVTSLLSNGSFGVGSCPASGQPAP